MARTFETERAGRVLTVLFDNPPLNFMNRDMVVELDDLLDSLENDSSIGSVILTGKPEDLFITHYDVEEILTGSETVDRGVSAGVARASLQTVRGVAKLPGGRGTLRRSPMAGLLELERFHDVLMRMQRMDKVFIAAINGSALAGGCELSLACDLRYMAESSRGIGLPEMTLGFNPGGGGTQRLTHILGPSRALELILEARILSPTEAHATAERLARRAPLSVAAAKGAVLDAATKPLSSGLAEERKWFVAGSSQPAARRAMRAYLEELRAAGPPFSSDEGLAKWQEGTVVDLVSED